MDTDTTILTAIQHTRAALDALLLMDTDATTRYAVQRAIGHLINAREALRDVREQRAAAAALPERTHEPRT